MAPMNSATAPIAINFRRPSALDPYEVARPFEASFEPIEKDIKKLKMMVSTIQGPILCLF